MIYLSPPDFSLDIFKKIKTPSPNFNTIYNEISNFEIAIQKTLKTNKAVIATNSGTSALHLSLKVAGIKSSDFVYCQSMTFVACANVILYERATPIFIDSEFETGNICPATLESAIKSDRAQGIYAKAVIAVHLYGIPAKIKEIKNICERYNLILIEDAAEAFGSRVDGKLCGTFGDYGILSFNYNKIISAAGGGALICKFEKDRIKALYYATQSKEETPHYEHNNEGYNYRIQYLQALLGNHEIKRLNSKLNFRKNNADFYKSIFLPYKFLEVREYNKLNITMNNWLTTISFKSRSRYTSENLRHAFAKADIESRPLWKPMHLQPIFRDAPYYGDKVSEKLFNYGLCLPSGSNLTDSDRARIEKVIFNVFNN